MPLLVASLEVAENANEHDCELKVKIRAILDVDAAEEGGLRIPWLKSTKELHARILRWATSGRLFASSSVVAIEVVDGEKEENGESKEARK